MKRINITPRANWQQQAESLGFSFHSIGGAPYWDETAYYQFTLKQIEQDLEQPTEELHDMCMALVADVVSDEALLQKLAIPPYYWQTIKDAWQQSSPHLYGRMDFSYNGLSPAKLLELNYDTPTSLYESAFFQFVWLEQQIALGQLPKEADQFNTIQEKLTSAFHSQLFQEPIYFSAIKDSEEDQGTVAYLRDVAKSAGLQTALINIEDIGLDIKQQFVDLNETPIPTLFKLYPWEFMFEDEFGKAVPQSTTCFLEPIWKAILSNKGILALLWEKYPNHPNLLPCFIDKEASQPLPAGWVRKPFLSREGANVELHTHDNKQVSVEGPYLDSPYVRQACHPLPCFQGNYTLIGSWLVGDCSAGIGIREDATLITQDTSRFLPHIILD